jgi:hypothetical protein
LLSGISRVSIGHIAVQTSLTNTYYHGYDTKLTLSSAHSKKMAHSMYICTGCFDTRCFCSSMTASGTNLNLGMDVTQGFPETYALNQNFTSSNIPNEPIHSESAPIIGTSSISYVSPTLNSSNMLPDVSTNAYTHNVAGYASNNPSNTSEYLPREHDAYHLQRHFTYPPYHNRSGNPEETPPTRLLSDGLRIPCKFNCGKSLSRTGNRLRHQNHCKMNPRREEPVKCSICKREIRRFDNLVKHKKNIHEK